MESNLFEELTQTGVPFSLRMQARRPATMRLPAAMHPGGHEGDIVYDELIVAQLGEVAPLVAGTGRRKDIKFTGSLVDRGKL